VEVEVPLIAIIAAIAQNGVIGKDGGLPWHLTKDLQHFKEVTMGQTVLFGRKTYESLGKILEGRNIVVLTNNSNYRAQGCIVEVNADIIVNNYLYSNDILYVAGGESIYRKFCGVADEAFISFIEKDYGGDAYFPVEKLKGLAETSRKNVVDNGISISFMTYKRVIKNT
jgi:dihydrofolate reductase